MHKFQVKISQLMKRTITIGLLVAVLAIAVGFISTNAISATPFLMAENELGPNESAYMIGHVEYTVRGADGQVKQYVQADNLIVDVGKGCAAQMIFDNSASDACAISTGTTGFNFIAIGNGTTGFLDTALGTQTELVDLDGNGCTGTFPDTCEMDRTPATINIVTSGTNTVATIATAAPFTFAGISSTTVQQSGLFDNDGIATNGNMFALRDSLAIPVSSEDTLTVTWTVTLK